MIRVQIKRRQYFSKSLALKCLELFRSTCSKVVASNEPKVWPTIPAQRGCHCLSVGTSLGHALKLHVVVGLPSLKLTVYT